VDFKYQKRKVQKLQYYPLNPRRMDADTLEKLKRSIQEFGVVQPLIVNTKNEVIGGNQRLRALKELHIDEVDVIVVDLSPEKEKALNLALNKITGEWDEALLKAFVADLQIEDIRLAGFDENEILNLELDTAIQVKEDNFEIEDEKENPEPITKRGDIYQLGRHRLMCGDATSQEDVAKLMDGAKADMVFTDPPYNVNYQDRSGKFDPIKGDNQTEDAFVEFSEKFIARMAEATKEGGAFYICTGYSSFPTFLWALRKNGFQFSTPIVWVKNNTSMGWNDYRHKHELIIKTKNPKKSRRKKAQTILYGWKEGRHYFAETRFEADVWEVKRRATQKMVHPTQKPIELVQRAMKNSSKFDNIVLDLFGGSGTTLIAAEQIDRIAYVIELDPHYCDIIIKRWENYTGQKAKKIE